MRIVRHIDAAAFLARAEPWLLQAEAEHNLILGIAHQLRGAGSATQAYFATVESHGAVVGCAFRTPPNKLGVTRMPAGAAAQLAADVALAYDTLPAVLGPEAAVREFADAWCARTGASARTRMSQRIYQLTRVVPPASPPAGELRVAAEDEIGLVRRWVAAFNEEADHGSPMMNDPVPLVRRGGFHIWWHDEVPRSMAAIVARTPNGVRVGAVYTPPAERGRGFASAAVAVLSQQALDQGARFCFLYTDLSNPTSNAIYQHIGYEPVADAIDCSFT